MGNGPHTYAYPDTAGSGARVYAVGGGVDIKHPEFGGRAVHQEVHKGAIGSGCTLTATPAAAVVAGNTYGVAKKAKVISVKIGTCDGKATEHDLIPGIAWSIKDNNNAPGGVLFLAAGAGEKDVELDKLVAKAHERGMVVVAGAGMGKADACDYSPGSAAKALTVAGTTKTDTLMPESTQGKCVDVLAPGANIASAKTGRGSTTVSGNAMAAGYAAGVAALLYRDGRTPDEVIAEILRTSSRDAIKGVNADTPNRLLFHKPA